MTRITVLAAAAAALVLLGIAALNAQPRQSGFAATGMSSLLAHDGLRH